MPPVLMGTEQPTSTSTSTKTFPSEILYYLLFLSGSTILAQVGSAYRIDRILCSNFPGGLNGVLYSFQYAISLALISFAWLGLSRLCVRNTRNAPSNFRLYCAGILGHLIVLAAPPFLSYDPLAYVAVGRAGALYGLDAYTPLGVALPLSDSVHRAIADVSPSWLDVGSAYWPGFNAIAVGIVRLTGHDLTASLRLFQFLGLISVVLLAWLAGLATGGSAARLADSTGKGPSKHPKQHAKQAVTWVLFCPLSLIEASNNAHNDVLLALSIAGFAVAITRKKPFWALVSLGFGATIKASGLLLLGFYLAFLLSKFVRTKLSFLDKKTGQRLLFLAAVCGAVVLWSLGPWFSTYASTVTKLLGNPSEQLPYCTRSIECLPRMFFHVILKMPLFAWIVGILFRFSGCIVLLYMASRSTENGTLLRMSGHFLFVYYLYLHGAVHGWYALALLPLLPFADRAFRPAMIAWLLASVAHYFPDFAWNCSFSLPRIVISEIVQALVVIVPPTLLLIPVFRSGKLFGAGVTHFEHHEHP